MSRVKLAIVYYSATGTNYAMATRAKEAAASAAAVVRLRKVPELAPEDAIDSNPAWRKHVEATKDVPEATPEDMEWANAYIFSMPTRFGNVPSQMKQFMDSLGGLWQQGKLADKPVTGFTSAANIHGGQETTLLALYITFHHWGCIIVPPGYTDRRLFAAGGNPYGVSTAADPEEHEVPGEILEAVAYSTQRLVQVASWLFIGQEQQPPST
jgi:NAD(P)H dehydrogenase (quinone)